MLVTTLDRPQATVGYTDNHGTAAPPPPGGNAISFTAKFLRTTIRHLEAKTAGVFQSHLLLSQVFRQSCPVYARNLRRLCVIFAFVTCATKFLSSTQLSSILLSSPGLSGLRVVTSTTDYRRATREGVNS